uniref:glycosyl hydrolase 53 family protein n=1 Tax=Agathobacter sp. TaxID=2021311 RepID=UPI003FEEC9EE
MKEKKTWKKRVLSIVLAFAMVLTQFGVWNAGKESVQAAENDSFTLYYYNESGANSAYAIKDGKVYEDLTEAGLTIKDQDQGETNSSEVTSDGYTLKLTADKTEVTVGDTITFTASLQKDGQEITDLTEAGYHIYWWNNTTNSQSEFIDYISDGAEGGRVLTMKMQPQQVGENEIKINLQDDQWKKIIDNLIIKIQVKQAASTVTDATVNVKKTDKELSSDFIMGMDISSMISELESGVVYRDYEGNKLETLDDICKFLANQGINHIRIRVWNNPYDTNGNGYGGGNNDVAKAKQFADACRNAGIKMLVDFHCSDLWTDPGKQYVPKAWKGYTVEQKAEALTAFLEASLNTIDPTKDVVDMVQVGNETTSGFIGETDVANMCTLFEAGSKGVKAYNNEVKVVIHLTNPEKANMTRWAKRLDENKVDYDILATSYYPYWHGTLDNLKTQLETVKNTYGKDVMVAETSYAYTLEDSDGHSNTVRVGNNDTADNATEPFTEQGQATAIRNLINTVNNAGGLGVYYWEPAWLTVGDTTGLTGEAYDKQVAANKEKWEKYGSGWASSYASEFDAKDAGVWFGGSAVDNEAMFYPDGTASPSLHVWNYVKTGAVSNEVSVEGMGADLTQEVLANSTFELPKTLDVMYSDETKAEEITWNETDVKKIDTTKAGTYQVAGTVTFSKEITRGTYKGKKSAEVTLTLKVKQANLITNEAAVEFDDGSVFTIDGTMFKNIPSTENPKSGKHSMSWYSAAEATGSVTYNDAITLAKGSYTFEAYAEGKDASVIMQVLNAENDSVLSSGDATEVTGWNEWKTPKVTFTLDKETSVKFRIAVENKAAGWGSVDVLYLHQEGASGDNKDNNGSNSGSSSNTTVVTPTDKDTTEIKNVTAATPSGEKVEATVTITKDSNGNVTDAGATVKNTKPEISTDVAAKIVEATGTDSVVITTEVTDAKGNIQYTVTVDAKNLTAENTLKVLVVDKKTGEKKLVNAKSYKVDENGTISVSLPKGCEYQLVTAKEVEKVEKAVLKTVEVKKTSVSVKKGKSTKIQLSSKLDMDNVKSVTYTTTKKSVVKVAKNGKITAKKKGTAVVKATVTLKSGKKKTVTMKVKVK